MALRYLLDEERRGEIGRAILHHNAHALDPIDVVRVGDRLDLPLSTADSKILAWAELAGRVRISRDRRTMIAELSAHLQAGHNAPKCRFPVYADRGSQGDATSGESCGSFTVLGSQTDKNPRSKVDPCAKYPW
jgi:hypothetical protein